MLRQRKTRMEEVSVSRKYNQRTKKWNLKVLKEDEGYGYISMILANIFKIALRGRRKHATSAAYSLREDNPSWIAPTIVQCEHVSAHELYERHRTRFTQGK